MAKKFTDVLSELQNQPGVSTPHDNMSILKGSFNLNALRRQYKGAPVLFERWRRDEIRICWDYDVPMPVKVVFPPTDDPEVYKANRRNSYAMSSDAGGAHGWFLMGRHRDGAPSSNSVCAFGVFTDGTYIGEPVMVEVDWFIRKHIRKDDIILAKVIVSNATVYGNTEFAGAETPRLKKLLELKKAGSFKALSR